MRTYEVILKSEVFKTFRCQKAADSLDINTEKKSVHHLKVSVDIESQFNIGLIVGSSGSGKTTLAKHIYGEKCFETLLDDELPIIEQLPKDLSYDECAAILNGIGLNSVVCWIRPVKTLSNGQRARCEAALLMMRDKTISVIDEWTSVVDRTVAKAMSHCVQKFSRKNNKRIVLCSCHYDIIEWLNPDWIIDCNKEEFIDRRLLRQEERQRTEKLSFDIREVSSRTWKNFSKYHYISERLPAGKLHCFGLFREEDQVGFQCFASYMPYTRFTEDKDKTYHFNRTVIHPDYNGLGLGIRLINETSKIVKEKYGYRIMGKFSSAPVFKAMVKDSKWRLKNIHRDIKISRLGSHLSGIAKGGFRTKVKTYSFEYIGHELQ